MTPLLANWFGITDISGLEPLLPIQILWINLVTDSLPALALAVDPAEKGIMNKKPKKTKGIFTKGMTWRVVYQGIMVGFLTLAAFIIGLATPGVEDQHMKIQIGQTMAFFVLALSELVHVFNVRDNKNSLFKTKVFNNSKLILAVLGSAALMLGIMFVPALREIFNIVVLPTQNLVEVVLLVFAPIVIVEIFKLLKVNGAELE